MLGPIIMTLDVTQNEDFFRLRNADAVGIAEDDGRPGQLRREAPGDTGLELLHDGIHRTLHQGHPTVTCS